MNFLLVLLCTVVLVFALKKPVKRFPVLFYGIAVLLDVLLHLQRVRSVPEGRIERAPSPHP